MSDMSEAELERTFQQAVEFVRSGDAGIKNIGNNTKLALYSYYKQATAGECETPKPWAMQVAERAKWDAWKKLSNMSKIEAMRRYLEIVAHRCPNWESSPSPAVSTLENPIDSKVSEVGEDEHNGQLDLDSPPDELQYQESYYRNEEEEGDTKGAVYATNMGDLEACDLNGTVYLVSGASGFLGKHLLDTMLKTRTGTILVLIRSSSIRKFQRLSAKRWAEHNFDVSRIVIIEGDISLPDCGVQEEFIRFLRGKVDHFFHLAASYNLEAAESEIRQANVEGTRNVLSLAEQLQAGILQYTSSIVVSGDYDGLFLERMYDEGQSHAAHAYFQTKFEAEGIVRKECQVPFRIYRPGIVIGSSETGEADKIDGPYYIFKFIQHCRRVLPQWIVLPCLQGSTMPLVPVDYVARAMDFLAHKPELNGRCFHLVDSSPLSFVDAMNEFAKAAHAPRFSARLPNMALSMIPDNVLGALEKAPTIAGAPRDVLSGFLKVPPAVVEEMNIPTTYDDSETARDLVGSGIKCPALPTYAWKIWDYFERHLDPALDHKKRLTDTVRGKVVLVTGASDGIGKGLAIALGAAGAKVLLVARTESKLSIVAEEINSAGGEGYVYPADLSSGEDCERLVQNVLRDFGHLDILVNNAGRSIRRSVGYSYDRFHDYERCITLNYFASLRLILGFLPIMRERKSGHIVNISSIGCQTNVPRFSAYVASKAALDAFSRCISSEVALDKVFISTVYMPLVRTKMIAPTNIYKHFPTLSVDQATSMILKCIVTKEKKSSTSVGRFSEIMYAFAPNLMDNVLNVAYRIMPEVPPGVDKNDVPEAKEAKLIGHLLQGVHL